LARKRLPGAPISVNQLNYLAFASQVFLNPVNGVMTRMPQNASRALWLVTGDVRSFDGQQGFAFIRAEHLLPLDPDSLPEHHRGQVIC
jgi:hypothetical protein